MPTVEDVRQTLRKNIERKLAQGRARRTTTLIREPDIALTVKAVREALHWQHLRGKPDLAPLNHTHQDVQRQIDALNVALHKLNDYADVLASQVDDVATRRIDASQVDNLEHTHPYLERTLDQIRFLIGDLTRDIAELTARVDAQDALGLPEGKPGQVLVKTSDGVAWEWLQPQVLQLKKKSEEPSVTSFIVDSEGTFLVDSGGAYVTAL